MKQDNNYYLEMPRGLLNEYHLSAYALLIYYAFKEEEQRYCDRKQNSFFSFDERIIKATGLSRNTYYKYKKELVSKGLLRVYKGKYGNCEYLLPYLRQPYDIQQRYGGSTT